MGVLVGDVHLYHGYGQHDAGVNVRPAKLANSARPNTMLQPVSVLKVAGYWPLKVSYWQLRSQITLLSRRLDWRHEKTNGKQGTRVKICIVQVSMVATALTTGR